MPVGKGTLLVVEDDGSLRELLRVADTTLPAIPAVLITGHEHLATGADRLGVPCLLKPFLAGELLALVRENIRTRGGESEAGLRRPGAAAVAGDSP